MMIKFFVPIVLFGVVTLVNGQSLSVDAANVKQVITMMGGDMERSGAFLQKAANKDSVIKWCISDIAFDVFRVKYDKMQEYTEGSKNMAYYADQVKTMQMIKAANPEIKFFATMKSDYNGYKEDNHNNLPTFIYNYACTSEASDKKTCLAETGDKSFNAVKYGRFLADYVEFMEKSGVPITYLSTAKEWTQVVTSARAKVIIETMRDTLAARKVAMPQIIDPGAWSISQGISAVTNYRNTGVLPYVQGFCAHNYDSNEKKTWAQFVSAAKGAGKMAWFDESSAGAGGPTAGVEVAITTPLSAYAERCSFYSQGIEGEAFFEIWSRGVNNETRSVYFKNGANGVRLRGYYIMKLFANNAVKSSYVQPVKTSLPSVSTMAFAKNGNLTLWVINESQSSYATLPVQIKNLTMGKTVEQTYWDSTSVITGVSGKINIVNDNLFDAPIRPRSINCFIIKASDGSAVNENLEKTVTLSPNPASKGFRISGIDRALVDIFDITGKLCLSETNIIANEIIDTSALSGGIYNVRIAFDDRFVVKKLVIN